MAVIHKLGADGSFTAGDTESRLTSYAYPTSPHADAARKKPERTAAAMMRQERPSLTRGEYDRRNWQRLEQIQTPWGPAQDVTDIGAGILRVDTASHGGYYVPPTLNALIPASWRAASFNGRGMDGWYEEDCDWSMVALAFPTTFPDDAAGAALLMFDRQIRPKIEARTCSAR